MIDGHDTHLTARSNARSGRVARDLAVPRYPVRATVATEQTHVQARATLADAARRKGGRLAHMASVASRAARQTPVSSLATLTGYAGPLDARTARLPTIRPGALAGPSAPVLGG